MKRLAIYTMMVLVLGGMALTLAHHAQTQDVTADLLEQTAPEVAAGGSASPVFSYQGQLLDAQGNPVTGNVPMIFRLYATATGGTACWTENHTNANAVEVQGGRFSVLLGSITPANADCLADSPYLELRINNETLSPRQLLTDAIVSNGSQLGTAIVGQDLFFRQRPDRGDIIGPQSGLLNLIANHAPLTSNGGSYRGGWMWLSSLDSSASPGSVRIHIAKDTNLGNSPFFDLYRVQSDGGIQQLMKVDENGNLTANGRISTRSGADLGVQDNGGGYLSIGNNPGDNKIYLEAFSTDGSASAAEFLITGRFAEAMPLFTIRANQTNISGNLNIGGTCNASIEGEDVAGAGETCTAVRITEDGIQTGAVIELNLMTPAEQTAGRIDRFTEGDLLCWSTQTERLETCDQANTRLVMAVANAKGLPIIQGAELVKVIGPVMAGDLLVASHIPGYAMANNNPAPGTVIGKAMDNFDGKSGLIKAMIFQ